VETTLALPIVSFSFDVRNRSAEPMKELALRFRISRAITSDELSPPLQEKLPDVEVMLEKVVPLTGLVLPPTSEHNIVTVSFKPGRKHVEDRIADRTDIRAKGDHSEGYHWWRLKAAVYDASEAKALGAEEDAGQSLSDQELVCKNSWPPFLLVVPVTGFFASDGTGYVTKMRLQHQQARIRSEIEQHKKAQKQQKKAQKLLALAELQLAEVTTHLKEIAMLDEKEKEIHEAEVALAAAKEAAESDGGGATDDATQQQYESAQQALQALTGGKGGATTANPGDLLTWPEDVTELVIELNPALVGTWVNDSDGDDDDEEKLTTTGDVKYVNPVQDDGDDDDESEDDLDTE
jgi:hypothetical protein